MKYEVKVNRAGVESADIFPYPLKLINNDGDLYVTFCKAPRTYRDIGVKRLYPNDRQSWNLADEDDAYTRGENWHIELEIMTGQSKDGTKLFKNSEGRHKVFIGYNSVGKAQYGSIPTKSGSKWMKLGSLFSGWSTQYLTDIDAGDVINVTSLFNLPRHVRSTHSRYHENIWRVWVRARLMLYTYRTAFVSNTIEYRFD